MEGLKKKYNITKADGSECDPEAEYFVLRIDKDPHARKALRAYADSVASENPELGSDLRYWLDHGLTGKLTSIEQRSEPKCIWDVNGNETSCMEKASGAEYDWNHCPYCGNPIEIHDSDMD